MNLATLVIRLLLGLLFAVSGIFGFVFLFMPAPPMPSGLAGQLMLVLFTSHWVQAIDFVELIAGALLLAGRYVPLALTLLGALLYNILVFHITMQPQSLPLPLVVFACWSFLVWRYRSSLAPLFVRDARPLK